MADANEEVRTPIILRLHKLLQEVHQELLEGRKGTHRPYRKRRMEVGGSTGPGLH